MLGLRNSRQAAVRHPGGFRRRIAACLFVLAAGAASDAFAATAAASTSVSGDCVAPSVTAVSPGPAAAPCVSVQAGLPAPLLAQSVWILPPGSTAREPPAGMILASVCLAWLVLLGIATVVRPRGWHHQPLFGRRRKPA